MSQNASRSTKGGGPPPPASGKVFQKQGVDGSNAKFSQNNNTFSNKSTKLLNNATTYTPTTTTTNNTNGSLDENHNQQQHTDKNGTVAQPLVIFNCFFMSWDYWFYNIFKKKSIFFTETYGRTSEIGKFDKWQEWRPRNKQKNQTGITCLNIVIHKRNEQ